MDIAVGSPSPRTASARVVSKTWTRDSHDLFDFEAQDRDLLTKTFSVEAPGSATFLRSGTDVLTDGAASRRDAPEDALLRLATREDRFWVDRARASTRKLWVVVRDLATGGHRLTEGDLIKLGRSRFRVRQLVGCPSGGVQPELRCDENGAVCSAESDVAGPLASTLCRICLLEGPGEDDPLIAPCSCKGSIEHVHLGCLRHWIRGRLGVPDAPGGSFFYKQLSCELCKSAYPTYVQTGEERIPLVDMPAPQSPYIVLESMARDHQQNPGRGLHVISLADKFMMFGRGHESDIRIADVSISRCHATIRFSDGDFILEDNNSKFGTLIAMRKRQPLESGHPISIQLGRTVLSFTMQAPPGGATANVDPE